MGSSREKGNFEGRARRYIRIGLHSWESTLQSSTVGWGKSESDSRVGDSHSYIQLTLDCFQEGLTNVADTEHVGGNTIGDQQRVQETCPGINPPRSNGRIDAAT